MLALLRRWSDRPLWQRIALGCFALATVLFLVQSYRKAYRPQGTDLTSYLLSAEALLHGRNPYVTAARFPYIYPLFFAFLLIPLAFLPYWLATLAWFIAGVGSGVLAVRLILVHAREWTGVGWERRILLSMLLVFLVMLGSIQNNLLNGQANFVVLALCVLFLHATARGRTLAAAAYLAAAIAIKLVPLIFVPYLVARRRYGQLALTAAMAVLFCALPAVFLGSRIVPVYRDYIDSFLLGAVAHGATRMFFTLSGLLTWLSPGAPAGLFVRVLCAGFVMLPIAIQEWRWRGRASAPFDMWMGAQYLLAILLISPLSETHHLAFAVPAVVLLTVAAVFTKQLSRIDVLLLAAVVVLFVLGQLGKHGPWYFLAIATAYAALFVVVRRRESTARLPDTSAA